MERGGADHPTARRLAALGSRGSCVHSPIGTHLWRSVPGGVLTALPPFESSFERRRRTRWIPLWHASSQLLFSSFPWNLPGAASIIGGSSHGRPIVYVLDLSPGHPAAVVASDSTAEHRG